MLERCGGTLPRGCFERLSGSRAQQALAEAARRFAARSRRQRVRSYAESMAPGAGDPSAEAMVAGMLAVYEHSFRASAAGVPPVSGDVLFLRAASEGAFLPGVVEQCIRLWEDSVLGDFRVDTTPGDHYSCLEEPHVEALAARILDAVDEAEV